MFKLKVLLHGAAYKELVLSEEREFLIGRSSSCDLQLGDQSGISRQHLRIYCENHQWFVQVLSKFGSMMANGEELKVLELHEDMIFKIPPFDFLFVRYDEEVREIAVAEAEQSSAVSVTAPIEEPAAMEEDFSDKTAIAKVTGLPFVRLVYEDGTEEKSVKLQGHDWTAGRDDSNHIFLNSPKASRKQFRIRKSGYNYLISDLGSSNGTSVNGAKLSRDEDKILQSGDVITVIGVQVHFEIRDPSFERRLNEIPAEMFNPPALIEDFSEVHLPSFPNDFIQSQLPLVQSQVGGVIRIDNDRLGSLPIIGKLPPQKRKFVLISTTVVGLLMMFIISGSSQDKQLPKTPPEQNQAFAKLSAAQKQLIKDSYNLAKSLQLQGKYALAFEQLTKIHELMPEGFLDSVKLAEEATAALKYENQAKELQADKDRMEQIQAQVKEVIFRCNKIASLSNSTDDVKGCLAPAFELDPENVHLTEILAKVSQRADESRLKEQQKRDYATRVERARAIYQSARTQENQKNWISALEAYNKLIKSGLPDPDGLKSKAERSIASIRQNMSFDIQKSITSAESLFKAGNFKEALNEVNHARKIDPSNDHARDLQATITRELNSQLQEIYSNSVLDEGLGNIEAAKEKWRKIIELDRRDGDYFKRARGKLKTYGAS